MLHMYVNPFSQLVKYSIVKMVCMLHWSEIDICRKVSVSQP